MATMNDIPALQNAEPQLRLLRGQRRLYEQAKRLLTAQVLLTIGVPVVGSLITLLWPTAGGVDLKGIVALLSLAIAILDVTLFERVQKSFRKTAAKMQEQFDCTVLRLPWNDFTVGPRVGPEAVHAAASKYNKGQEDPKLRDWYPVAVGQVPIHLARIICQRTNLWYDSSLRRWYAYIVLGATIALPLILFLVGFVRGLTIESFVISVLAPAAPIIVWGVREYLRQRDTTDVLDRVLARAENLWDRAKAGTCSDEQCLAESRQFQDAIFERRSTSAPIFNWVYKLQRPQMEDRMNRGAED
jgi:hypothetical protein